MSHSARRTFFNVRGIVLSLCAVVFAFFAWTAQDAHAVAVASEAQFRAAIAANSSIELGSDFTVSSTIEIPGTYNGTISGAHTLTSGTSVEQMFKIRAGANVTFDSVTLDAAKHGKLIDARGSGSSDVTLKFVNATVKNGTSLGTDERNGGAMYLGNTKLTVTNSTFLNNDATKVDGVVGGNGGAIFIIGSTSVATITNSTFTGNHTLTSLPGSTGGAIHVENGAHISDTGSTWNIARQFNTGGAVRLLGASGEFRNSRFIIGNLGDGFGISGGALSSENSDLTVRNSTFDATAAGYSKVTHAGGFVTLVGSGNFKLLDSTMTGAGVWHNGPRLATYGGAIAFESDSTTRALTSQKALIENTTITNVAADSTGGAIDMSIKKDHVGASELTLKGSSISNTRTFYWGADQAGGAVFVGPGNSFTMDKNAAGQPSKIANAISRSGGGIYNQGTVLVTGGSTVSGGYAPLGAGGGAYNDGVMTLDETTWSGNLVSEAAGNMNNPLNANELGGKNIYAKKDVTITPRATLDAGDVRVFDKQSAVILTGDIVRPLNISISETPKSQAGGEFDEDEQRFIGYIVAKGNGTYVPTAANLTHIHYASKDSNVSTQDNFAYGKWVYVLDHADQKNGTGNIVVGQRAKFIYHPNKGSQMATEHTGQFAAGTENLDAATGTVVQPYTYYKSVAGARPLVSAPEMTLISDKPTRDNFTFAGWYGARDNSDNPIVNGQSAVADRAYSVISASDAVQNFSTVRFTNQTGVITSLLTPFEAHTYAGWIHNIDVKVVKTWQDFTGNAIPAAQNLPITVTISSSDGQTIAGAVQNLPGGQAQSYTWENLPAMTAAGRPITYTVTESNVPAGAQGVTMTSTVSTAAVTRPANLANSPRSVLNTSVTNRLEPKVTVNVSKQWQASDGSALPAADRPASLTVTIRGSDGATIANAAKTLTAANNYAQSWDSLPLRDASGQIITYTVTETPVSGFNAVQASMAFTPSQNAVGVWTSSTSMVFTNRKVPDYGVTYAFRSGTPGKNLPLGVTVQLPHDSARYTDGSVVSAMTPTAGFAEVTDGPGKWAFQSWDHDSQTINATDIHFIGTWVYSEPLQPVAPPQPGQPPVPVVPVVPQPKPTLAKTGVSVMDTISYASLALIMAGAALIMRQRKRA